MTSAQLCVHHALVEPHSIATGVRDCDVEETHVAAVLPVQAGGGQVVGALVVTAAGKACGQVGSCVLYRHALQDDVADVNAAHGLCQVCRKNLSLVGQKRCDRGGNSET